MTQRIELGQIFALFCERRESRYRKKQEEYCGPYQDALGAMGIHRLTSFPVEQSESPAESGPLVQAISKRLTRVPSDYEPQTRAI